MHLAFLCTECGTETRPPSEWSSDFNQVFDDVPCPMKACGGGIKGYEYEGAILANLMDRSGFDVQSFHICRPTDSFPYISLVFHSNYELHEPPKPFHMSTKGKCITVESSYTKPYRDGFRTLELAEIISRDIHHLCTWVRQIIQEH